MSNCCLKVVIAKSGYFTIFKLVFGENKLNGMHVLGIVNYLTLYEGGVEGGRVGEVEGEGGEKGGGGDGVRRGEE